MRRLSLDEGGQAMSAEKLWGHESWMSGLESVGAESGLVVAIRGVSGGCRCGTTRYPNQANDIERVATALFILPPLSPKSCAYRSLSKLNYTVPGWTYLA